MDEIVKKALPDITKKPASNGANSAFLSAFDPNDCKKPKPRKSSNQGD